MKPAEIATQFAQYIEEGTTPKGVKVQSFFNNLPASQMRVVANNIAKAYEAHQKAEAERAEMMKKRKTEISELKKKAKELGLVLSEKQ